MHLTCKDHRRRVQVIKTTSEDIDTPSNHKTIHRSDATTCPSYHLCIDNELLKPFEIHMRIIPKRRLGFGGWKGSN